jgi:LCP family protein required for cell wall assembly
LSAAQPEGAGRQPGLAKRFALGAVLVVAFTAAAVATTLLLAAKGEFDQFKRHAHRIPGIAGVLDPVHAGQPQTILLLGSDRRFADIAAKIPARSDTIIVVHLDPNKHATAVMSLPRDLKVAIPGYGRRKINEAYRLGGPRLTVRTVQQLLGIEVHHVINVNFGGFRRAVDRIGCVYADVDRRYFNDKSGPDSNYATIDLKAGYQKLCGSDALDYVRFRHLDSDLVRGARQQEFLRQAKDQVGLAKLVDDRKELLAIFGHYTDTDIASSNTATILGLLKLVYESSKSPVTEIKFPATDCPVGSCLEISRAALRDTVDRFIAVRGTAPSGGGGRPQPKRAKGSANLAAGLGAARDEGENEVLAMSVRLAPLGLPVYFPSVRVVGNGAGYAQTGSPRSYEIFDRSRKRYRAYRIVLYAGELGQYYGVQGTTWKAAPILDDPTDERTIGGHRFRRYFDGSKIRMLAFETPKAVYWVANTLSLDLTNSQMTDIARSLTHI